MRELSLNILDIAQNSLSAEASLVSIEVEAVTAENLLSISVKDNGYGMDEEFLKAVTDPFVTSRKTRRVGFGISFFKMASELSGGQFHITSKKNSGTEVFATFVLNHIDRMPLGDISSTLTTLIAANPKADFLFKYSVDGNAFELDTREIKNMLDGVPINNAAIVMEIGELISENIKEINGTRLI